jgi:L-lactate dehydrogenase (cytochrome)
VAHADFQNQIYFAGLAGALPALPTDLTQLAAAAAPQMSATAAGYVDGGAGSGATMRANREAFDRVRIVPRLLRDVSEPDMSVEILGTRMPAPIMLGPIGVIGIFHPDAELAVARAAAEVGATMVLSTVSSTPMEEVAAAGGDSPRWFQLYWPKDRELAASFLARARAAGFGALVVTIDTYRLAWRPHDLDQAYLPFLQGLGVANYWTDPVFKRAVGGGIGDHNRMQAIAHWTSLFGDPSLTWDDLAWLREHWAGPIVLKGIQHPDDARRAAAAGMDGVIVSNHGGRQVDGAIGSLDALPGVVAAAGDELTILFDSGVRTGADVLKALALGARAVLIGRPYVHGLALAGQGGVAHVLRSLYADFEITMALAGLTRPDQLTPDVLVRG